MTDHLAKTAYKIYKPRGVWDSLDLVRQNYWRKIVKMIAEKTIEEYQVTYECGCDVAKGYKVKK